MKAAMTPGSNTQPVRAASVLIAALVIAMLALGARTALTGGAAIEPTAGGPGGAAGAPAGPAAPEDTLAPQATSPDELVDLDAQLPPCDPIDPESGRGEHDVPLDKAPVLNCDLRPTLVISGPPKHAYPLDAVEETPKP